MTTPKSVLRHVVVSNPDKKEPWAVCDEVQQGIEGSVAISYLQHADGHIRVSLLVREPVEYWSLLVRDGDEEPWSIEFGSYSRKEVVEEKAEYRDNGYKNRNLSIICTAEGQEHIESLVRHLNVNVKG